MFQQKKKPTLSGGSHFFTEYIMMTDVTQLSRPYPDEAKIRACGRVLPDCAASGSIRATKLGFNATVRISVHSPLGAWACRPLKWRPRCPRSQEKAGGRERLPVRNISYDLQNHGEFMQSVYPSLTCPFGCQTKVRI